MIFNLMASGKHVVPWIDKYEINLCCCLNDVVAVSDDCMTTDVVLPSFTRLV